MSVTDVRADIDALPRLNTLPTNVSAEQALLGSLLCDNRGFAVVSKIIHPKDFAWSLHGRIFAAISQLIDARTEANPVTLAHCFENDPTRPGQRYLVHLARSAVTLRNNIDYALIIADLAIRRDLIAKLQEASPGETVLDLLTGLKPRLRTLAENRAKKERPVGYD